MVGRIEVNTEGGRRWRRALLLHRGSGLAVSEDVLPGSWVPTHLASGAIVGPQAPGRMLPIGDEGELVAPWVGAFQWLYLIEPLCDWRKSAEHVTRSICPEVRRSVFTNLELAQGFGFIPRHAARAARHIATSTATTRPARMYAVKKSGDVMITLCSSGSKN